MTASFFCIHILVRIRLGRGRGRGRGFYRKDRHRVRIDFLLLSLRSLALFIALPQLIAVALKILLALGNFSDFFFGGEALGGNSGNFAVGAGPVPAGLIVALQQNAIECNTILHQILNRGRRLALLPAGAKQQAACANEGYRYR
jgi:hypothetical protein